VDPQRQHPYSLMRRRRNIEGTNSFESKGQRGEMKTLTVSTFAAGGLAALCLGLTATAAQAAPSGPINAADAPGLTIRAAPSPTKPSTSTSTSTDRFGTQSLPVNKTRQR
jgi:hypothetical protein